MARVDLSIIILSYNTKSLLIDCLTSVIIAVQHSRTNSELIIVDNKSSDDSVSAIKQFIASNKTRVGVKLIESKTNLGFAGGNNLGITKATGDYLLFLNSDTVLYQNALSISLAFMQVNHKVGALSVKTLLRNGKVDVDCHRGFPKPWASITYFLGLEKLFPKSRIFGQYHQFYLDLNTDHEIEAGAGAFMLISRAVIARVGVWDDSYFFYGEDLDYFYRIRKAGFKVYFLAEPLLTHYKGASSGLRKESQSIAKNSRVNRLKVARSSVVAMEIFYRKFYAGVYPAWLTAIVLIGIRVKGFFRLLHHYLQK